MISSVSLNNNIATQFDSTQRKLLLLFVFDKMEMPLSSDTIYDFCTSTNQWLNYIDCNIAFSELLSAKFVASGEKHAGCELLYHITEEGRTCLSHFFSKIPSSVREDIILQVKQQRMSFKRKQEYFADYSKNEDGSYSVTLRITEPEQPVFEIVMNVPSRTMANKIYEKWGEKAACVYQAIYDQLLE